MRTINKVILSIALVLPAGLAGAATASAAAPAAAPAGHRAVHVVRPGQSIQAALDAAHPGDTVLVRRGVYHEAVEIDTDGITLAGQGAVLEPPPNPRPNRCATTVEQTGTPFGLCVIGALTRGLPPTLVHRINNVTVRGMVIHRFPSTGIVVLGGNNVRIEDSQSTGGTDYGMILSQTTNGNVVRNNVTGGDEAGIYIGDSPRTNTNIRDNYVYNSGTFGVFLRDSSLGTVTGNRLTTSCVGIGAMPTKPDPGDVADWTITHNRISGNDGVCDPPDEGGPSVGGTGVLLAGTSRMIVSGNDIVDNQPAAGPTPPPWNGGLVMVSAAVFGGPATPAGNVVVGNTLRGNHAFDLNIIDKGRANHITANRCQTSSPAGLC